MEYRVSKAKHDQGLCAAIGEAFGQAAGGWSIGHRHEAGPSGALTLVLPDGVATVAELDALVAAYSPPVPEGPRSVYTEAELVQMADGVVTIADARAMLRLLARSAAGRIPKPPA